MSSRATFYRNIILFLTALSLWSVWLPLIRTLSGQASYVWGVEWFNASYSGVGWEGDYLFLIYQVILGVAILWMGFRNPKAPFAALLILWHALPFANALYGPLVTGDKTVLYGDTAGIEWDLTWVMPIVTGLMLTLVLVWIFRRDPIDDGATAPAWHRVNSRWLALFGFYIVGVTVLEWTGLAHGLTDLIAVSLNILAPILIALMFYPWKSKEQTI